MAEAQAIVPETRVLLQWSAPMRVFKPLDLANFRRLIVWSVLLSLILIFFKEFVLVLAIFSLLFFSYVMGTVPPAMIVHRIGKSGITTAGHSYLWSELKDFYFVERVRQPVLVVETTLRPSRLVMVLEGVERTQVESILTPFIPFRAEAPRGTLDSLTERLAEFLNLA